MYIFIHIIHLILIGKNYHYPILQMRKQRDRGEVLCLTSHKGLVPEPILLTIMLSCFKKSKGIFRGIHKNVLELRVARRWLI